MRPFVRSLLSAFAVVSLTLTVGATAVLAAPATTQRLPVDEAWCFDDVVYVYCTEIVGHVQFVTIDGQRESASSHRREHVVVYQDGVVVGETRSVSNDRFSFDADGTYTIKQVVHTRATFDGQTCSFGSVFRLSDFDVTLDHVTGPVCH